MHTEPNANDQAPGAIPRGALGMIETAIHSFDRDHAAEGALCYFMEHSAAVGAGARAVLDAHGGPEEFSRNDPRLAPNSGRYAFAQMLVFPYPEDDGLDLPCVMAAAKLELCLQSNGSGKSKRCGRDEPGPSAMDERKAASVLAALNEHAQFLRSLGVLAHVEDEGWRGGTGQSDPEREFSRQLTLYAFAPLFHKYGRATWAAFEALQELVKSAAVPDGDAAIGGPFALPSLAGALLDAMGGRGGTLPACLAKSPDELEALAEEWRDAGYDIAMFEATGDRWLSRVPEDIEPLVDGAIFRGKLHAFLGGASTGKSTALHELAVKLSIGLSAAAPPMVWCGLTIRPNDKPRRVHFFSGEDTRDIIGRRARAFAGAGATSTAVSFPEGGADGLRRYLQGLKGKRRGDPGVPDLIVIDPALTFLDGCESDAGDVGAALGELVEIAAGTEAAVVVAHHLQKNANPRSMRDLRAMVRGSQVWIDRPRIVLGFLRTRDATQLGVVKSNIPGVEEFVVLATLTRDPTTLMHMPAEPRSAKGTASTIPARAVAPSAGDLDEPIMAALRRLIGEGKRVTLTGKNDGFRIHAPAEVAGVARDTVLACLRGLIEVGRIARAEDGALRPAEGHDGTALAAE